MVSPSSIPSCEANQAWPGRAVVQGVFHAVVTAIRWGWMILGKRFDAISMWVFLYVGFLSRRQGPKACRQVLTTSKAWRDFA